jgi:phytoene/squalene synthetase
MDDTTRALVLEIARSHALDYYLAALLSPRAHRDDLFVLAAFEGEMERIPGDVSEPMVAEIRLQWWRDWIAAFAPGSASGNPVADALADVVLRHRLDRDRLISSIDARSSLDDAPLQLPFPGTRNELLARDAAAMQRAAQVLGAYPTGDHESGLRSAGLALSFARRALATRAHLGQATGLVLSLKGDLQQARHNLMHVKAQISAWPRPLRLAALPVALVEPYLRACEGARKPDDAGKAPPHGGILPLTRVWRLWSLARLGRL